MYLFMYKKFIMYNLFVQVKSKYTFIKKNKTNNQSSVVTG